MPAAGGSKKEQRGGVLVLRVWGDPDGELIGRVQWTTEDGHHETVALASTIALLREVRAFLCRADDDIP
jgi:hypothetical protein